METMVFNGSKFANALAEIRPQLVALYSKGVDQRTASNSLRDRLAAKYGDKKIALMWSVMQYNFKNRQLVPMVKPCKLRGKIQHTAAMILRSLDSGEYHGVWQFKVCMARLNRKMSELVEPVRYIEGFNRDYLNAFLNGIREEVLDSKEIKAA